MLYLIIQVSINNDTTDICRYKTNPFMNITFPFISSFIFPPTCVLYYAGGYDDMNTKTRVHPECKKVYQDEFKRTVSFATMGALTGLAVFSILTGNGDIALFGCASITFPELRLNCSGGSPSCGGGGGGTSSDCSGGSSGSTCSGSCGGGGSSSGCSSGGGTSSDCSGGGTSSDCSGGGTSSDCSSGGGGTSSGCSSGGSTSSDCSNGFSPPTITPYFVNYLIKNNICLYTGRACR